MRKRRSNDMIGWRRGSTTGNEPEECAGDSVPGGVEEGREPAVGANELCERACRLVKRKSVATCSGVQVATDCQGVA